MFFSFLEDGRVLFYRVVRRSDRMGEEAEGFRDCGREFFLGEVVGV